MLDLIQNEFKKGNFDESKRLCLSSPNYIQNEEILNLLGLIELESNNTIKAIKYFKLTLKINPANVKTLNNIGHLLLRRKKNSFAINFLKKAIENDKKFFSAYLNLSIVYKNLEKYEDSINVIKSYLHIDNSSFEAYANLGKLYFDIKNYKESLNHYNIALQINNANPLIYYNLALLFEKQNKFHNAINNYKKSIELKSDFYDSKFNLSLLYFKIGKCKKGINLYDSRFYKNQNRNTDIINKSLLNLSKHTVDKTKKIYILAEQGYGDIFQFSRLVLFLNNNEYKTCFVINDELFDFYSDQSLFENLIKKSEFLKLDLTNVTSIPMMSIPKIFDLNIGDYTFGQYIFAKKEKSEKWSNLANKDSFSVGIAWQAGNDQDNYERSVPIKFFNKLAHLKQIKLISLHPKKLVKDFEENRKLYKDIIFLNEMDKEYKFVDTAAIISNLDLVISIDTAIAHLSAAMNKETWITLSYNHDWRWGLKNMKSHWYKSVKLFRADSKNNWQKVFENIIRNFKKK